MTRRRRRLRYDPSPFVLRLHAHARVRPESGRLPVSCWCERHIVVVDRGDVQAGRTESCGHPTCHAPAFDGADGGDG